MEELIIVAGPNGAGKTSFAKRLCRENGYPFLNADEIARAMPAGSPRSNHVKAGRLFLQEMRQMAHDHRSFVAESTLSGRYLTSMLQEYRAKYCITIIYVFLSEPYMCVNRIVERVKQGGHHVTAEEVLRRYYRSKQRFWFTYRYLCDRWELVNNDQIFVSVASGVGEKYTLENKPLFDRFLQNLEHTLL